ncbi:MULTISPECIES: hypothetical protein [unclassified Paenibacillus]|uniref:hypothetical protein n=1 Tax=unclassified Paenibacillus TaxID=185978 RepID=UPI001AE96311|nr:MULTISPECIES: hypothetical protein [unclassified Paenibacillus]MBP1156816.1 hypothetical protein [Paenibacillus sp. PvP091]MBP1172445.1 hypothetical protein [Paenibacillus sp. PvR098]MBP2438826.1 hypothetical protein [Paenibacillus sp. PvP052]
MSQSYDSLCPWCQTEIVWDPEIGPEETCPHCFNELGDYRSLNVTVKPSDQQITMDEEDDEDDYAFSQEDMELMDEYEERVGQVLDSQEEAPECGTCHSLMLFAGTQKGKGSQEFVPFVHDSLKKPLLTASFSSQVYVCPSCFKVEYSLAEGDRLAMIELLRSNGSSSS